MYDSKSSWLNLCIPPDSPRQLHAQRSVSAHKIETADLTSSEFEASCSSRDMYAEQVTQFHLSHIVANVLVVHESRASHVGC